MAPRRGRSTWSLDDDPVADKKSGQKPFILRWLGAVTIPLGIFSAYLYVTRLPSSHLTSDLDFGGLAVSVLAGMPFVATLPVESRHRMAMTVLYIPAASGVLVVYGFWFLARVLGEGM